MMLAFFMMLLTPEGWEVCKDSFQKEDMEIPDVNWKDAPKFEAVFCPTILKHDKNMHSHLAWIQQICGGSPHDHHDIWLEMGGHHWQ
jgi:hypothetical protein